MDIDVVTRKEAIERGESQFYTGKPCKYGHDAKRNTASGMCLACSVIRVRRWREANPEKHKALAKRGYEKTAEVTKARAKKWYCENKEKAQLLNKNRALENKDQMSFYKMKNRAKRLGCESSLTFDEMMEIKTTQTECRYCGETKNLTYDHIVPHSKMGGNNVKNIQRLCISCNSKKRDLDEVEYLAQLG